MSVADNGDNNHTVIITTVALYVNHHYMHSPAIFRDQLTLANPLMMVALILIDET